MAWGINPNAPIKEKIKAEFNDHIQGLNSVGEITYTTYSNLYDFSMPLFDRMYEEGTKSTTSDNSIPASRTFELLRNINNNLKSNASDHTVIQWLLYIGFKHHELVNVLGYSESAVTTAEQEMDEFEDTLIFA